MIRAEALMSHAGCQHTIRGNSRSVTSIVRRCQYQPSRKARSVQRPDSRPERNPVSRRSRSEIRRRPPPADGCGEPGRRVGSGLNRHPHTLEQGSAEIGVELRGIPFGLGTASVGPRCAGISDNHAFHLRVQRVLGGAMFHQDIARRRADSSRYLRVAASRRSISGAGAWQACGARQHSRVHAASRSGGPGRPRDLDALDKLIARVVHGRESLRGILLAGFAFLSALSDSVKV